MPRRRMGVKLLDCVRDGIRTRHYSRRTEDAYVYWIRRYIVFHKRVHPSTMGAPEISAFLTWLAVEQRLSASTQNQAFCAVLFLQTEHKSARPHRETLEHRESVRPELSETWLTRRWRTGQC